MFLCEAGAAGVGGDLGVDFEGEGEGGAAGFCGDAGWVAGLDGVEKVFEFEAKGFVSGDVGLGEVEAGGGMGIPDGQRRPVGGPGMMHGGGKGWPAGCIWRCVNVRGGGGGSRRHRRGLGSPGDGCGDEVWVDGDGEEFLAGEVEGEVLVGLEEAELADLLGGDAGGGEVGDAAGGEFEADVGDVGLAGEDGEADGADFFYGGVGEGEDDVEVVDHEVEDDVDVEGAGSEDAEAVGLEEHGVVEGGEGGGDGGVEALEMTDGDEPLVDEGGQHDLVGFCQRRRKGFFDEDVHTVIEQLGSDSGVVDGGNADAGGVRAELLAQVLHGGEGGDVVEGGEVVTASGVWFDEGGEVDEPGMSEFELAVDAEVVAPEGAGTDDGYAYGRHLGYLAAVGVGDSTAWRQRA